MKYLYIICFLRNEHSLLHYSNIFIHTLRGGGFDCLLTLISIKMEHPRFLQVCTIVLLYMMHTGPGVIRVKRDSVTRFSTITNYYSKGSTWVTCEQAKTVSRTFTFSWRYIQSDQKVWNSRVRIANNNYADTQLVNWRVQPKNYRRCPGSCWLYSDIVTA